MITDSMTVPAGKAYLAVKHVPVKISGAGYSTLYTDKALDFAGTGLTAYIVKVYGGNTMLSEVSDVPAYTGVVLKGEEGNYKIPVIDSSSTDVSANKLVGFLEDTVLVSNDTITYSGLRVLPSTDEVGFAMITDSMTVPAGKAYLKLDTTMPAANAKTISFGNHVTGIESVGAQPEDDGIYYNLMGIPVENPQKGLYIKNGKKVIVK